MPRKPYHTRGLSGALEQEAYVILVEVMRRYGLMRKRHLNLDTIAGIVDLASQRAYDAVLEELTDRGTSRPRQRKHKEP
jgi:hypothetical protein